MITPFLSFEARKSVVGRGNLEKIWESGRVVTPSGGNYAGNF